MARRYKSAEQSFSPENTRYLRNVLYPTVPLDPNDMYIVTSMGDRYDTLAAQFYGDSSLWWVIACANNFEKSSLNVQPGVQLRIPADYVTVEQLYTQLNKTR